MDLGDGFAQGQLVVDADTAASVRAHHLVRGRKFAEAVAEYDTILARRDRPNAWVNRGVALQALGRLDEALESFDRSLTGNADYAAGLINRGVVLGWLCRNDEALASYDRALELEPDNESGRLGRGVIRSTMGDLAGALADADYVLERNPGSGAAHYNKALVLLSMGEYLEGFREHEWRFGTRSILGAYPFPHPVWTGQRTSKRILVRGEQGLGDTIQFARYVRPLVAKGLNIVLQVAPALVSLFRQLEVPVYAYGERLDFDWQCPIMSLAAVAGTTLETVPYRDSYLRERTRPPFRTVPKVGVCWSSGVRPDQVIAVEMHKRKTLKRRDIDALIRFPGVEWVSLQKDLPDDGTPIGLLDSPDMLATSALIERLDLVISVDSAVAHLAGALGKPVWVLNRKDICWRWLSGDVVSPWYESARVYRQSKPLEWGDVIARVHTDLKGWLRDRS